MERRKDILLPPLRIDNETVEKLEQIKKVENAKSLAAVRRYAYEKYIKEFFER